MYISGEISATWVQEMPLLALGISSNAGKELAWMREEGDVARALDFGPACQAPDGPSALPSPDELRSCNQRRREIIVALRKWRLEALSRQLHAAVAFPSRRFPCARCDRKRSPVGSGLRDRRARFSRIFRAALRLQQIFAPRPATSRARGRLPRNPNQGVQPLKNAQSLRPTFRRGAQFRPARIPPRRCSDQSSAPPQIPFSLLPCSPQTPLSRAPHVPAENEFLAHWRSDSEFSDTPPRLPPIGLATRTTRPAVLELGRSPALCAQVPGTPAWPALKDSAW